jgi:hypothetical protein
MIIPPLQGKLSQDSFFIYTACDTDYFDDFGKILINSINCNTNEGIHVHLYNPRPDQLEHCDRISNVSYTWETVEYSAFQLAADHWTKTLVEFDQVRYGRILNSMGKGGDTSIQDRMRKTYFACARFIRLSEILSGPANVFSIDVDAIVRQNLPRLPADTDLYIHKNKQFLAGGVYLTGTDASFKFLQEYATRLKTSIEQDYIYWSLDQDVLDQLVPNLQYKELPRSFIDWNMKEDSYIWTAKGKRKDLEVFKNEKLKYKD